jgi:hypothetical protein
MFHPVAGDQIRNVGGQRVGRIDVKHTTLGDRLARSVGV